MLAERHTKGAVAVFNAFDVEDINNTDYDFYPIISLLYDDDTTVSYTTATCTYPY
jgi:hypothetical protein